MSELRKFSDDEKEKIRAMAIALEYELKAESEVTMGLDVFAQHPQLVHAIEMAKEKAIAEPSQLLNLSGWLRWPPLEEWFYRSNSRACGLVFKFSAATQGFPHEEMKDDDQETDRA